MWLASWRTRAYSALKKVENEAAQAADLPCKESEYAWLHEHKGGGEPFAFDRAAREMRKTVACPAA